MTRIRTHAHEIKQTADDLSYAKADAKQFADKIAELIIDAPNFIDDIPLEDGKSDRDWVIGHLDDARAHCLGIGAADETEFGEPL